MIVKRLADWQAFLLFGQLVNESNRFYRMSLTYFDQ